MLIHEGFPSVGAENTKDKYNAYTKNNSLTKYKNISPSIFTLSISWYLKHND